MTLESVFTPTVVWYLASKRLFTDRMTRLVLPTPNEPSMHTFFFSIPNPEYTLAGAIFCNGKLPGASDRFEAPSTVRSVAIRVPTRLVPDGSQRANRRQGRARQACGGRPGSAASWSGD